MIRKNPSTSRCHGVMSILEEPMPLDSILSYLNFNVNHAIVNATATASDLSRSHPNTFSSGVMMRESKFLNSLLERRVKRGQTMLRTIHPELFLYDDKDDMKDDTVDDAEDERSTGSSKVIRPIYDVNVQAEEDDDKSGMGDGRAFSSSVVPLYVKMVSPMVRYSKLPFRVLCRMYGADLCFTPMLIAEDINHKDYMLLDEFSTEPLDRPLIAQFATNQPVELALAAERLCPYVDGADLNCGCPQKWVIEEGIGAALSSQPELVHEMVRQVKAKVPDLPVSIKIRLQDDMRVTLDLIHRAERMGVDWITVHGRTPRERSQHKVHVDAIKFVKSIAAVPIIANGDIFSPADMDRIVQETKVDGVMCARGALANPAMFCGEEAVPLDCVIDYLQLALKYGGLFTTHHHHLMFMLFGRVSKADRREFSLLRSLPGILDYFHMRGWFPLTNKKESLQERRARPVKGEDAVAGAVAMLEGMNLGR